MLGDLIFNKETRKMGPVTCPVSVSEVSNTGVSATAGEPSRGETWPKWDIHPVFFFHISKSSQEYFVPLYFFIVVREERERRLVVKL